MIHSSTSRGVIVSDLSSDYYRRTYAGAGYVDKFRRMLSETKKNEGSKSGSVRNETEKSGPVKNETPVPSDDTPFKFVPVSTLPTPKNASKTSSNATPQPSTNRPSAYQSTAKQPSAPRATTNQYPTISTVTPGNTQPSARYSEEEARKAVLNALIEQKLDSIFNK